MKKWYVAILAVLVVGLATAVFSYGPPFGDGGPPFAGPPGFAGPGGYAGFRGPVGFGGGPGGFRGPAAFGGPFGPGGFPEGFGPEFGPWSGGYLNLSKGQTDKVQALRNRYDSDTRDLRYELDQKALEVRKLFTDPKADETTLLAKQKEISALRQKLFDKMAQMPAEARKILTPDQIEKLAQAPVGPARAGFGPRGFWK